MNIRYMGREDAMKMDLKSLYRAYGYEEYRLSGFEDYAFYAENENFLNSKDVIAVNAGGKLLALRSDVTLSIAKNIDIDAKAGIRKLFYDEKVFRKAHGGGINEISQIGVEIMGELDRMASNEICDLMFETLNRVSAVSVVDVSHMGIIVKAVKMLGLDVKEEHLALECLMSKNSHDFLRIMRERGKSEREYDAFLTLINLPSDGQEAISKLKEIQGLDIAAEVSELEDYLLYATGNMQVDFSIVGDYNYYNGIIFKGYVAGVPKAVLSGGRYDKLLEKFGKDAQAIGFALYLGELDLRESKAVTQPDAVFLYDDDDYGTVNAVSQEAARMRIGGTRVLVSRTVPEGYEGSVTKLAALEVLDPDFDDLDTPVEVAVEEIIEAEEKEGQETKE